MIQNVIALTIVFSAVGYTVFSIIKNLAAKKSTKCGGCEDCSFHESPMAKPIKIPTDNFHSQNLIMVKHGK